MQDIYDIWRINTPQFKKHMEYYERLKKEYDNRLDKLFIKSNDMKITPKTTIEEIIPEGYELHESHLSKNTFGQIDLSFTIKKKEEKNFEWYVERYLIKCAKNSFFKPLSAFNGDINDLFREEKYEDIPFEYRIGLLKFICDSLNCEFHLMYRTIIHSEWDSDHTIKIKSICPKEFFDSLLK